MINKRKLQGTIIGAAGIIMVKINFLMQLKEETYFVLYIVGVFVSCLGIAVFTSGLNKFIIKKIKICPNCFCKNISTNKKCDRCKEVFNEEKNHNNYASL